VHKRRLGTQCETCHNARAWTLWDFNHDRRTRFRLEGGHRGLDCYSCHNRPVTGKAVLPMSCVACHDKDDVHEGAFGRQCDKCHGTDSFKRIRSQLGMTPAVERFDDRSCNTAIRGVCRGAELASVFSGQGMLVAARGEAR